MVIVSPPTGDPMASPVSSGGSSRLVSSPTSWPRVIRSAATVQSLSNTRRSLRLVPSSTFMDAKASRSCAGVTMPAWCSP